MFWWWPDVACLIAFFFFDASFLIDFIYDSSWLMKLLNDLLFRRYLCCLASVYLPNCDTFSSFFPFLLCWINLETPFGILRTKFHIVSRSYFISDGVRPLKWFCYVFIMWENGWLRTMIGNSINNLSTFLSSKLCCLYYSHINHLCFLELKRIYFGW